MENFIKTIMYILIIILLFLIIPIFIQSFDILLPYIIIDDSYFWIWKSFTYNIIENNIYFQLLLWLIFILSSIYLILFLNIVFKSNKCSWQIKEYFIIPFSYILSFLWLIILILYVNNISSAIWILFYDLFNIELFWIINNIFLWILVLFLLGLVTWVSIQLLFLNKKVNKFLFKNSNYVLFTIIVLIFSLFILKPNVIQLNESNICYWNDCYLYTDIKAINMDYSSYNIEIIFKPFNKKIPINFSRNDLTYSEECYWDENNTSCYKIHDPILNIDNKIKFILSMKYNLFVPEKLNTKNNYDKILYYIISKENIYWYEESILYPGELSNDWNTILHLLYRKTNIIPNINGNTNN